MKIPQGSRVRASVSHRGAWISVEGQGPGGTWSWRLVEKKLVLLLVTASLRQKTPKEDMLLPSPAPHGPGDCWVSGSVLPQEEVSPLTLLFQTPLCIPLRIPSHTHRPVAVVLVVPVLVTEVI